MARRSVPVRFTPSWKRVARRTRRAAATLVSTVLVVSGMVWAGAGAAQAAPLDEGVTPTAKMSDYASWHRYPGSMEETDGSGVTHRSLNAGRIWTDKTVFRDDAEAQTNGIDHDLNIADDEFAVALSALGTTLQVRSTRKPVIDLVIVIDNSNSMNRCVGNDNSCTSASPTATTSYRNSRAYAMVQGVNAAIEHIVDADADARVSIVAFGAGANVLTPLAKPETVGNTGQYLVFQPPTSTQQRMMIESAGETLTVGYVGNQAQGTNIQRGISTGLTLLANQKTSDIAGDEQHIPSLILFSDGEPTYSAAETQWWNLTGTSNRGPGSSPYYGNGFLAALSAGFLKNRVTDVYNDEAYNDAHGVATIPTNIYTVGLGVSGLGAASTQLAYATLDPTGTLPAQGTSNADNSMATSFGTAMNQYVTTGTTTVTVNSSGTTTTTVGRPSGNVGSGSGDVPAATYDPTYEQLKYNTTFNAPKTAEELLEVFEKIANQVVEQDPTLPIETTTPDPNADGYVTFTDPLGPFMRMSDMDSIVFCSVLQDADNPTECEPTTFRNSTTTVEGNTTTYTFSGSYEANDLFPETSLSHIIVTVKSSPSLATGDVVTVRIPVALLPMVNTRVLEDPEGGPLSMSWYQSHPVHVYFKVAPKAGVAAALTDPTTLSTADQQALTAYLADNARADGTIRFYANAFTSDGATRTSQASATFRPSRLNDFYRFARDSRLYSSQSTGAAITPAQWNAMGADDPVYFTITEYSTTGGQGSKPDKTSVYVQTTKQNLLDGEGNGVQVRAVDGVMVAPAGLYDLSARIDNLDMVKCADDDVVWAGDALDCAQTDPDANRTQTDTHARQTDVVPNVSQSVRVRLGNNGWMQYAVPGAFEIAKRVVTAQASLTPDPDQAFDFTVRLSAPGGGDLDGTYPYVVADADGDSVDSGTVGDGGTITLRGGQHARVMGLPDGAAYSVTEQTPPAAYTPQAPDVTDGTIAVPQESIPRLTWTNSYDVDPATIATVQATKTVDPHWVGDSYTARLCPIGGAPVPEDGNGTNGCVTAEMTESDPTVGFGNVTFTRPGTFEYNLVELPTPGTGVTDSLAVYRWQVTVSDDGHGALTATTALRQIADGAGQAIDDDVRAPAEFINTWSTEGLQRALEVFKFVQDTSLPTGGQARPPQIPYRFTFSAVQQDASGPDLLFADGSDSAQVEATPGTPRVPSPPLEYSEGHVGHTYYYKAQEDAFDSPTPGLTLTDAVWFFQIDVGTQVSDTDVLIAPDVTLCQTTQSAVTASAPWGDCDPASADYAAEPAGAVFVNDYDPDPATAALTATKTIDGRTWGDDDSFTFSFAGADQATLDAIDAGDVVLPDSTTATATAPAEASEPNLTFGKITFTKQGVYRFAVTEQEPSPNIPGITPDPRTLIYTVTVSDTPEDGALSGQLEAEVTPPADGATFVNTFRALVPYQNLTITKTLTGRESAADEFSFVVTAQDDASRDVLGWSEHSQTFTNTAGGPSGEAVPVTRLPQITFTQADLGQTYTYVVTEEDGDLGGVTYDGTQYTVEIAPQYDFDSNEMWVRTTVSADGSSTVYDSRTDGAPTVGFANTYEAGPGTATIPFEKWIVGRDWKSGDSFDFELTGLDGAPLPAESTVAVTADSDEVSPTVRIGQFGPISFSDPGTYQYEIRERQPIDPEPGMDYDSAAVAEVTVLVTDDGSGTLQTEVRTVRPRFENTYQSWALTKSSDPASGSTVQPGQTVTYTLTATNTADSVLRGAEAVDDLSDVLAHAALGDLPEGLVAEGTDLRWTIPELAPGDSASVSYAVTVDDDAVGVTIRNVVTGDGSVPPPAPCPTDDPECRQSELHTPEWTLVKSSDPGSGATVVPGDVITYTLTARNLSDDAELADAVVTDDLSDVLSHAELGTLPDGASLDGTTLRWQVSTLAPGASATLSYSVTVADDALGQTLRNVVTATGPTPPDPCADDDPDCRVTEHLVPSWTLAKSSDPASGDPVEPGDVITYTLTARNTGPAELTGAHATDDVSDLVSHATLGDLPAGLKPTDDGRSLEWTIPTLAPGATASVSYTATVGEDVWGATVRNALSGTGVVPPSTCTPDEPCVTEHPVPLWTVHKTSDPASGSQVQPGSTIDYTLTVRNTGPVRLMAATVTDDLSQVLDDADLVEPLPAGLTLSGTTLTWQVSGLATGASTSITYRVSVHEDAQGATLHNVATPGAGGVCADSCSTTHHTPVAPPPGELPVTGGTIAWGVGTLGAAMLAAGGILLAVRRRRRLTT